MGKTKNKTKFIEYHVGLMDKLCEFIVGERRNLYLVCLFIKIISHYGLVSVEMNSVRRIIGFTFQCKECSLKTYIYPAVSMSSELKKILKHLRLTGLIGIEYRVNYITKIGFEYYMHKCGFIVRFIEHDNEFTSAIYETAGIIKKYKLDNQSENIALEQFKNKYLIPSRCRLCDLYMYAYHLDDDEIKISHVLNHIIETRKQKSLTCRGKK